MTTEPWEDELSVRIAAGMPGEALAFALFAGQPFFTAHARAVPALLHLLKDELGFDFLVDLTAIDYPKRADRFDLIYILYSYSANRRIRLKTAVAEGAKPASATPVYRTANWLEREIYDMFGIEFAGHPNLKRILLPEGWSGFPLRKDYSIIQQDQAWVQEHLGIESGQ